MATNKLKITAKFRPKADAHLLYELNEQAWQRLQRAIYDQHITRVRRVLAEHLRSLYPPADMDFLARYRCATDVQRITVRIRTPDSTYWDQNFTIELDEPIKLASSFQGLWGGGPRYSQWESRGVNASYRAELEAKGEWDAFLADQDRRDRESVPEELNEFFYALCRARDEYQRDYKRITEWPKAYNQQHGHYPTWSEIAQEFPATGSLILEAQE